VNPASPPRAQLVVVGLGIEWAGQTTKAAQVAIEMADRVLFAVATAWGARWIRNLNPNAEPLAYPRDGRPRRQIYQAMVSRIMEDLARGGRVCVVFYGHPGILVAAGHEAVRRARAEGHAARMLPGVSSLDCLFADLGVDPGARGCQMFEATSFIKRQRPIDPTTPLVLYQIALVDNHAAFDETDALAVRRGLERLRDRLATAFPANHPITLYEAASHPLHPPRVETLRLSALAQAATSEVSTLFVPALAADAIEDQQAVRTGEQ